MKIFTEAFWKDRERRDAFLERAGLYLLYAFILSIAANPFIMLAVGRERFNFVLVESSVDGKPVYLSELSDSQKDVVSRYRLITQHELDDFNEFENRITWVVVTALLGWCVTSPRFMRGWPKLRAYFDKQKE